MTQTCNIAPVESAPRVKLHSVLYLRVKVTKKQM